LSLTSPTSTATQPILCHRHPKFVTDIDAAIRRPAPHPTIEVGFTTTTSLDQASRLLTSEDPVKAAANEHTAYRFEAPENRNTLTHALDHVRRDLFDANRPENDSTRVSRNPESGPATTAVDPIGERFTRALSPIVIGSEGVPSWTPIEPFCWHRLLKWRTFCVPSGILIS
jgi:hypothetical protein